ncbi:ABC-2 family transporter protein [Aquisphaera giovannonii]|uniref:ABC-2 family transporter protein n=1 Tax=Aquisphaera giovannonii TaxID=406548 RepID=A0A5B9WEY3_9BACT|nr:ABC transporter permease subunit [Aquisphaera giovannonii]QEH39142.1 ABC-2 family transporter protein [Aquisphaera giovannonii]
MTAVGTMLRRQLGESRWFLGLAASALFGLGWLSAFIACRVERRFREVTGEEAERFTQFTRGMGGAAMDFSSLAFQVMFWSHPFVFLILCTWAISRGTAAVAGELERGTLDVTLSRPVSRAEYLATQVIVAVLGFLVLAAALVVGNRVGGLYNPVSDPPTAMALIMPATNLALVGLAVYGYSLLCGSWDVVRWRPNLFSATVTIAGYVAGVASTFPTLSDWEWIGRFSVFKAFDPVEVAVTGATFAPHAAALGAVAAAGIVLAFVVFLRRDLPSNT